MYSYYLIGFALLLVAAVLVTNDASKRGYNGVLWGLIVVLMPMMGLFVYLVYVAISDDNNNKFGSVKSGQSQGTTTWTKTNREHTQTNDSFIGNETGVYCTSCGKPNRNDATFCKYCGSEII